jgi:[CysO sulfur-carrier protein]-S-L-cysteine hydrolase
LVSGTDGVQGRVAAQRLLLARARAVVLVASVCVVVVPRMSDRLALPAALRDQIVQHARAGIPNEACGLIGGRDGVASSFHPVRNADESPYRYTVHPDDLVRVWAELEDADDEIVSIYHSHTKSAPYPSRTDVELATWPDAAYLIVSLRSDPAELSAFRIVEGRIEELALEIT